MQRSCGVAVKAWGLGIIAQLLASSAFAEPPRRIAGPWPGEYTGEPAVIVFDAPVPVTPPPVPNGVKEFAYSPDYQHVLWLEERGFKMAIFVDGKEIMEAELPDRFSANEDFTRMHFRVKGSTPNTRTFIFLNPEGRRIIDDETRIIATPTADDNGHSKPGAGSTLRVAFMPRPDRVVMKVDEKTFDVDGKVITLSGPRSTPRFHNGGRHAVVTDGAREFQVYVNGELRGARAPKDDINVTEDGRAWCTARGTLWVDGQAREISKDVQHAIVTPDLKHVFQIHKSQRRLFLDGKVVAEGYDNYLQPTMMPDGKGFVAGYVRNDKPGLLANSEAYPLEASVDRIKFSPKGDRLAVLLKNGALIVNGVVVKEGSSTRTFTDGDSLMYPTAAELQFTPDGQHVFWPSQNKSLPDFWVDGNRTKAPMGVYAASSPRFTSDSTFEYFVTGKQAARLVGRLVPASQVQTKADPKPEAPAPPRGQEASSEATTTLTEPPQSSGSTVTPPAPRKQSSARSTPKPAVQQAQTPAPPPQAKPSPKMIDNPIYANWAKHQVGTAVTFRTFDASAAGAPSLKLIHRLKEVNDEFVILEVTMVLDIMAQERPGAVSSQTISKRIDEPAGNVVGEGEEEIKVGDRSFKCRWVERSEGKKAKKTWHSDDIPGGTVKTEEIQPSGSKTKRTITLAIGVDIK